MKYRVRFEFPPLTGDDLERDAAETLGKKLRSSFMYDSRPRAFQRAENILQAYADYYPEMVEHVTIVITAHKEV